MHAVAVVKQGLYIYLHHGLKEWQSSDPPSSHRFGIAGISMLYISIEKQNEISKRKAALVLAAGLVEGTWTSDYSLVKQYLYPLHPL